MQLVFSKKRKHADRAREEWGGEAFVGGGNGHVPGICCRFKEVRRCGTVFFQKYGLRGIGKGVVGAAGGAGVGVYAVLSVAAYTVKYHGKTCCLVKEEKILVWLIGITGIFCCGAFHC